MPELARASVRLARFASSTSRKILEFRVVRREPRRGTILFLVRGVYTTQREREGEGEEEREDKTERERERL